MGIYQRHYFDICDCGWLEFNGQYPWDQRPNKRISATILRERQNKLDNASDKKLKVILRKLPPDLIKESKCSLMNCEIKFDNVKQFS
ncbi:hypothetical protein F8M41_006473 [Gigaspora margarita]|uniref:Uncharacterized protein n=1 Tax=Gigaspora margarita TaxID=4874 RepID=A0A8H3X7A8_GIGMA|nr:hypothetical protein F8M41_006473 [Gigaspora margarita]